MNHKNCKRLYEVKKKENGYTLVEVIIAIAICGFGLATILGLYGVALQTNMLSENILDQSLEINSITDEIYGTLGDDTLLTLSDKVNDVLSNYPCYSMEEIVTKDESSLHTIKISQKGYQCSEKIFYIKVYWRSL